jgi:hypothetical protein
MRQSFGERGKTGFGFDSIECRNPVERLLCRCRFGEGPVIKKLAAAMRPASDLGNRRRRAIRSVERVKARIAIGLKEAGEARHMRCRVCAAAIRAVKIDRSR